MDNNVQSILKFNLDTKEGRDAHFRACKADMAYRALHEICENVFRNNRKYGLTKELANLDNEALLYKLEDMVKETIFSNGIDLMEEYK